MTDEIQMLDSYLTEDPAQWLEGIPNYQRRIVDTLLAQGKAYDAAAESWLSASLENTFPFGGDTQNRGKGVFLEKLIDEIESYLCGGNKYKAEREKLFGEKSIIRTYVVSSIAVAVAPSLGVSATFLAPAVALVLASLGKITINAWCTTRRESRTSSKSNA